MSPIFTNNYYVNGLRDWCATPNCTSQDPVCVSNRHTIRKVLFVGDIDREWIQANIQPTYECAYISRVIESLLFIRLRRLQDLERLILSDAQDAMLSKVEHLTLSTDKRNKAKRPLTNNNMGEDTKDKVADKEKNEMNRVQYLIAMDHLVETNKEDDDGDISLGDLSDDHGKKGNSDEYISLEGSSNDHPEKDNNENKANHNSYKNNKEKSYSEASTSDLGINIDADMWRLNSIRLIFEAMYRRHKTFPPELKIHVSFTRHYLRKLNWVPEFDQYKTVELSKAPPRPIVETFLPGSPEKRSGGHKQENKRLRMDRPNSGGGGEELSTGLDEACKLFQERIIKEEEEERKEREIAIVRKWRQTTTSSGNDGEDDDESGDGDGEDKCDPLEENYDAADLRPQVHRATDPNLEQSYIGLKRLRLEEDDEDDYEDKYQGKGEGKGNGKASDVDDHVQRVEGTPEEDHEDL
ncbi:hypothetical protein MVEG_04130 [Podila verticillata NRRL 6337]|nr:hypothetical protein MVEG_04130 [Podila verticillata NRRL 6337]